MEAKEELLRHALELFSTMGYEACGIQEICLKAGVTKPTLYHHFGSKRGLLDALVEIHLGPFVMKLEPAFHYKRDLQNNLEAIARVFFTFAETHPKEFRLYLTLGLSPKNSSSRQSVLKTENWIVGKASDLFAVASADHGNMAGRHLLLTASLIGMLHTFGSLISDGRIEASDELVYKAVHQFSHGIYS
jgi:AcrR family transcriptional regulator